MNNFFMFQHGSTTVHFKINFSYIYCQNVVVLTIYGELLTIDQKPGIIFGDCVGLLIPVRFGFRYQQNRNVQVNDPHAGW